MAFRWRADDGPTLNAGLIAAIFQGIRTSIIAKKPYIFVIFQGGGSGPPVPHPCGSAHVEAFYSTLPQDISRDDLLNIYNRCFEQHVRIQGGGGGGGGGRRYGPTS